MPAPRWELENKMPPLFLQFPPAKTFGESRIWSLPACIPGMHLAPLFVDEKGFVIPKIHTLIWTNKDDVEQQILRPSPESEECIAVINTVSPQWSEYVREALWHDINAIIVGFVRPDTLSEDERTLLDTCAQTGHAVILVTPSA